MKFSKKYLIHILGYLTTQEEYLAKLWNSWGMSNSDIAHQLSLRRHDNITSNIIYKQYKTQVNEGVINYGEEK